MPVLRDTPYAAFNFLVSLEGLDPGTAQAGFTQVSGLNRSVEFWRIVRAMTGPTRRDWCRDWPSR